MKIVLKNHEDLGDLYTIVRAEHDGKEWWEQTEPNCRRFMMSERLSPEACIEGNSHEMLALADAIKGGHAVAFKRCAVSFEGDGAHFCSPKNSERDAVVSVQEALALADQILAEVR